MTTAAHAHSLPSPHSIPSPLRPPDLTSCNVRRCSSCRCSNMLRTPCFVPSAAASCHRRHRCTPRPPSAGEVVQRSASTSPLPGHHAAAAGPADECAKVWLGERCERRQRQQQPHRPRARKRARNHQAGRSTPPASSAELLAARCGSSSSCSRAPRHRRESQKLADGCARALRALKFAR